MARCNLDQLQSYFAAYGWTCRLVESNACVSGWESSYKHFPLRVTVNDTVLSFNVDLLAVGGSLKGKNLTDLKKYLLLLNHRTQLVRISLNQQKVVVLNLDALTEGFAYEHMHQILGIIGYYSDLLYSKIAKKLVTVCRNGSRHVYLN